jgi:hypothetical protein
MRIIGPTLSEISDASPGEQDAIFSATSTCSKSEWMMLLAGLGLGEETGE